MESTVVWQRVEGAVVLLSALAIYFYLGAEFSWWLALLVFLAPDISVVTYLIGPKTGSIGYNLVHLYAFGALFLASGLVTSSMTVATLGALWLAHSGFDRMLGLGLKSQEGFYVTHLGPIGLICRTVRMNRERNSPLPVRLRR